MVGLSTGARTPELSQPLVNPLQASYKTLSTARNVKAIEVRESISHSDLPLLRSPPIQSCIPCRKFAALYQVVIQIDVTNPADQLNRTPTRLWNDREDVACRFVIGPGVVGQEIANGEVRPAKARIRASGRIDLRPGVLGH